MNCLHPLKHWGRVFESYWSHVCQCLFILFVLFCVWVETLRLADPPTKKSNESRIKLKLEI
jgi:hypothetical protein